MTSKVSLYLSYFCDSHGKILIAKGSKFRPTLILRLEQGVTVDARLSADTRRYLEDLVNHRQDISDVSAADNTGGESGDSALV